MASSSCGESWRVETGAEAGTVAADIGPFAAPRSRVLARHLRTRRNPFRLAVRHQSRPARPLEPVQKLPVSAPKSANTLSLRFAAAAMFVDVKLVTRFYQWRYTTRNLLINAIKLVTVVKGHLLTRR